MSKIRIGVMGCASIAQRSMIPAMLQLPEKYELIAVASRTEEKAANYARMFNVLPIVGYENLLDRNDIDAIYMPLPTGLHEEWINKSIAAGKHILAEKSLAMDFQSASRMVESARKKKLLLMENFMFIYHSQHQWTWQQLREKTIGDIRLFRSQFGFPPLDKNNFRYDKAAGGGSILDAAAYTVKASQWFLGKSLRAVTASLHLSKDKQVDIYGNASLINDKGIVAQISFGFDCFYQCNYEFWGSRGRIFSMKAFTPKADEKTSMLLERQGDHQKIEMNSDNHFLGILKEFYRSITTNEHDAHLDDVLSQSRILSEVKEIAVKNWI